MAVEMHRGSAVKRLKLDGEYDLSRKDEVTQLLRSVDEEPTVVIDLSRVTFMDSTILGALMMLRHRDPAREIEIAGANGNVRRLLEMVGFDKIFQVTKLQ